MDAILGYKPNPDDDFYQILGCDELSTMDQILAEYRIKAVAQHPDKNPDDPEAVDKFQKLQKAKDVLCDENLRADYDLWRRSGVAISVLLLSWDWDDIQIFETLNNPESCQIPLFQDMEKNCTIPRLSKMIKQVKKSKLPSILLLGPPGSGKTTLGNKLKRRKDFSYVNIGHLLRDRTMALKNGEEPIIACVDLAPKDAILHLAVEKMHSELFRERTFLLQGFPTDIAQYVQFEKDIGHVQLAFLLDIPDSCARQRLYHRRECRYRSDDALDVVERRLRIFHENVEPLAEYLHNQGKLVKIDGTQHPECILQIALTVLKGFYGIRRKGQSLF